MNFATILIIAFLFQPFGIAFKVLLQIGKIHDKNPKMTRKDCRQFYWNEDWNVVMISILVWALQIAVQCILHFNGYTYLPGLSGILWAMGGTLLLGFGGHVLIYMAFGTAMKKAEAYNNKLAGTQTTTTIVDNPKETIVQQTEITPKNTEL